MRIRKLIILLLLLAGCFSTSHAISFALDSIAEWGKFPRFVVNTYRWGDRFFNGYDTAYVVGTGYKFNIKMRADSWMDYYNFDLPNRFRMRMTTKPTTSAGLQLTYLAVSIGYNKNFSHLFGGTDKSKEQFFFGFNCSLFACNLYYINNHSDMKISKFGPHYNTINPHIDNFTGAHSTQFGFDLYYFFNHKKYSQAAAYSYSRIQCQSQGSWFAGFSYNKQDYDFDFSSLPQYMKDAFPESWKLDTYAASNHNYLLKVGYGYNWVFAKNWLFAVSESPTIGLKKGFINDPNINKTTFALANQLRMSVVWNHGRWFAGLIGELNANILYDKDCTFENATGSLNLSVGYRFNLW